MFKKKSNVVENIVLFPSSLGSTSQGNNNEKDESVKEM